MKTIMIGLDIAKNVFQVHGIDEAGNVVHRRQLRRSQLEAFFAELAPAVVGMEACGTAHHWARLLQSLGHEVRLMAPAYVKPYVKRNKTDGRDAEAICEAMQRPTMRFVAVKSVEQQAVTTLHRARALLVRQRTALANTLRGLLAEFGVVAPQGTRALRGLIEDLGDTSAVPPLTVETLVRLARQWEGLDADIQALDRRIIAAARHNEAARRLMEIPGVGPISASAILATVGDARQFRSGRGLAAWLGLTPRQNNSGNKRRSGGISKQGERHIRTLLILGASAHLRHEPHRKVKDPWLTGLMARRPVKVAAVARAAKTARIIWALLTRGERYRAPVTGKARLAA
jgi:transposase